MYSFIFLSFRAFVLALLGFTDSLRSCFMPLHHLRPEMDYNPAVPLFLKSGECHDTIMIHLQKFDDRMYLANKVVDQSEADNTEMDDDTTKWSNTRTEDNFLNFKNTRSNCCKLYYSVVTSLQLLFNIKTNFSQQNFIHSE